MISIKKLIIIIIMLTLSFPSGAYAGNLNLSTYHSSAVGNYSYLGLAPQSALSGSCKIGGFYSNTTDGLQYCADDGSGNNTGVWGPVPGLWNQMNNNIFLTNYTNTNLKVGVGTSAPHSLFHLSGSIPITFSGSDTDGSVIITDSKPLITLIGENSSSKESELMFAEITPAGNYFTTWVLGRNTTLHKGRLFLSYGTGAWWDAILDQRMMWAPGKVGIGMFGGWPNPLLPLTQLHLRDNDQNMSIRLEEATGAANTHGIWELQATGQLTGPVETRNALRIFDASASVSRTRFMIQKNGNIGIGKSTPVSSATIEVADKGTLKIEGSTPELEFYKNSTQQSAKLILDNNLFKIQKKLSLVAPWNDYLIFGLTNRYVAMGNNITPAHPLHIAGGANDQILAIEHAQPYFEFDDTNNLNWQLTSGFEAPGENRLAIRNNYGGVFGNILTIHDNSGVSRVGIGVNTPDSNKALQLYTGAYIRSDTGDICASLNCMDGLSDRRLKQNISSLKGALDKINALRVVSFFWKDAQQFDDQQHIGFIAQEVEQIFPQWVIEKPDGYKALDINGFEGLVVEGLRELNNKIKKNFSSINHDISEIETETEQNFTDFEELNKLFNEQLSILKNL